VSFHSAKGKAAVTRATLLVIQGVEQGARFEIGEAAAGIGRGPQNEIRLLDTEASRTHARLSFQDGQLTLADLGSSNGTFVNGRPVRLHSLADGDQIQIGRSVLLFSLVRVEDPVRDVSHKVLLLGQHDPADQSKIVGVGVSPDGSQLHPAGPVTEQQALEQTLVNLQVLYRISEEAVRPAIAVEQMLQRILDLTLQAVGADRGCMLLRDPLTGEVAARVFSPMRGKATAAPMPVSRTIVDYVLKNRQGVRTSDAKSDSRFAGGQSIVQGGIREAICVPMQGRYELAGVIYVDISTGAEQVLLQGGVRHRFSEDLLRLMVAIGRQAALAVEDQRYQQALVKAERLGAVGQTIATLSHHIKNILQGVRGGSYLIDMGLRDHNEDVVRKGWNIVEKNQTKIYNLVMDMLTFSKERQPVPQLASVNETVQDICELMQARATEQHISLAINLDERMPQTLFDPEGLHRAVLNIINNALDAVEGQADGRILIETGHDPVAKLVYVVVTDNGPGISEEQRPKLFTLFESTKGGRGTGLGLAVSQKILREHGGEITVISAPGAGAQFTLEWPLIEHDSASESETLA
jgi:two-component system NtrC family sensor kinase